MSDLHWAAPGSARISTKRGRMTSWFVEGRASMDTSIGPVFRNGPYQDLPHALVHNLSRPSSSRQSMMMPDGKTSEHAGPQNTTSIGVCARTVKQQIRPPRKPHAAILVRCIVLRTGAGRAAAPDHGAQPGARAVRVPLEPRSRPRTYVAHRDASSAAQGAARRRHHLGCTRSRDPEALPLHRCSHRHRLQGRPLGLPRGR